MSDPHAPELQQRAEARAKIAAFRDAEEPRRAHWRARTP